MCLPGQSTISSRHSDHLTTPLGLALLISQTHPRPSSRRSPPPLSSVKALSRQHDGWGWPLDSEPIEGRTSSTRADVHRYSCSTDSNLIHNTSTTTKLVGILLSNAAQHLHTTSIQIRMHAGVELVACDCRYDRKVAWPWDDICIANLRL